MALHMDVARANSLGIGSPFKSVDELMIPDPLNASNRVVNMSRASIPIKDIPSALFNLPAYQNKIGVGCSGWGIEPTLFISLLPVLPWFVALMVLRYIFRGPLALFGIYMGVVADDLEDYKAQCKRGLRSIRELPRKKRRKLLKFQNQLWLTIFYIVSSVYGYYMQRHEPWFSLPVNSWSALNMVVPHPYNPSRKILTYYHYGLAFYFAELFSLVFVEAKIKRIDFVEYVFHHLTTLLLMVFSHIGWEHRFGVYVLFIHDASDIMLSFSKVIHYMVTSDVERERRFNERQARLTGRKQQPYPKAFIFKYVFTENFVTCGFALFVVTFFYFRMYCLPSMVQSTFGMASVVRHGNFNMWMLSFTLSVALQGLHVYWSCLIISMIFHLIAGGERKDIRSDDEFEADEPETNGKRTALPVDGPKTEKREGPQKRK